MYKPSTFLIRRQIFVFNEVWFKHVSLYNQTSEGVDLGLGPFNNHCIPICQCVLCTKIEYYIMLVFTYSLHMIIQGNLNKKGIN